MKVRIPVLLAVVAVCGLVTAMVVHRTPQDIPAPRAVASVSVNSPVKKLKRGRTYDFQVRVDLTGVTAPGLSQPASLGSYVIPIAFDKNALEFISSNGGDTPAFGASLSSSTNATDANAKGLVTLVGTQTSSDSLTGAADVATVHFRVIAAERGSTSMSINAQLAAPGLSLSSTARSTATVEPYRIPAAGLSSTLTIK